MSDTAVFYRGPSGTVIDGGALEQVLEDEGCSLKLERDSSHGKVRLDGGGYSKEPKLTHPGDDPCTAVIIQQIGGRAVELDSESFPARERVEGTARLLRRILPEPTKVVSYMAPEQWDDFLGAKANA